MAFPWLHDWVGKTLKLRLPRCHSDDIDAQALVGGTPERLARNDLVLNHARSKTAHLHVDLAVDADSVLIAPIRSAALARGLCETCNDGTAGAENRHLLWAAAEVLEVSPSMHALLERRDQYWSTGAVKTAAALTPALRDNLSVALGKICSGIRRTLEVASGATREAADAAAVKAFMSGASAWVPKRLSGRLVPLCRSTPLPGTALKLSTSLRKSGGWTAYVSLTEPELE